MSAFAFFILLFLGRVIPPFFCSLKVVTARKMTEKEIRLEFVCQTIRDLRGAIIDLIEKSEEYLAGASQCKNKPKQLSLLGNRE